MNIDLTVLFLTINKVPKELTIEALEERYNKYPEGTPLKYTGEMGRNNIEKGLGVTLRKMCQFFSDNPIVTFRHRFAMEELQRNQRKRMGPVRALDIPYWGKSSELVKYFKQYE